MTKNPAEIQLSTWPRDDCPLRITATVVNCGRVRERLINGSVRISMPGISLPSTARSSVGVSLVLNRVVDEIDEHNGRISTDYTD